MMQANHAGLTSATASSAKMTSPFSDGSTAKGVGSGNKNTTYFGVFRNLSTRSDVYLTGDYMQLTNAYRVSAANGYRYQTEIAIGLRIRTM
jgi:predicted porin